MVQVDLACVREQTYYNFFILEKSILSEEWKKKYMGKIDTSADIK